MHFALATVDPPQRAARTPLTSRRSREGPTARLCSRTSTLMAVQAFASRLALGSRHGGFGDKAGHSKKGLARQPAPLVRNASDYSSQPVVDTDPVKRITMSATASPLTSPLTMVSAPLAASISWPATWLKAETTVNA